MLSLDRVDWICVSVELPRGVGVEADGAGGEVRLLGQTGEALADEVRRKG
jgi:hypothetical protein